MDHGCTGRDPGSTGIVKVSGVLLLRTPCNLYPCIGYSGCKSCSLVAVMHVVAVLDLSLIHI